MHVYAIESFDGDILAIHSTVTDAHIDAKRRAGREHLQILLCHIATDKSAVLQLLRCAHGLGDGLPAMEIADRWEMTARGALRRAANQEV